MAENYLFAIGGTGLKIAEAFVVANMTGAFNKKVEKVKLCCVDIDVANPRMREIPKLVNMNNTLSTYSNPEDDEKRKIPAKISITSNVRIVNDEEFASNTLSAILSSVSCKLDPDVDLADALFKQSQKKLPLGEGTKGDAQLGSYLVAKETKSNEVLSRLIAEIQDHVLNNREVNIMITGSIYGGSGSSGMPTLYRTIRSAVRDNRTGLMGTCKMGLCLMLPYFEAKPVEGDDYAVQNYEHALRSKIALRYYSDVLSGDDKPEYIGYVGGKSRLMKVIPYNKNGEVIMGRNGELEEKFMDGVTGGENQHNPAMPEELYAALMCMHFLSGDGFIPDDDGNTHDEYVINDNNTDVVKFDTQTMPYVAEFSSHLKALNIFSMVYDYYFRRRIWDNQITPREMDQMLRTPLKEFYYDAANNVINIQAWKDSVVFRDIDSGISLLTDWFNEICYNSTPRDNLKLDSDNTFKGLEPRYTLMPYDMPPKPRLGHRDANPKFSEAIGKMRNVSIANGVSGQALDSLFLNLLLEASYINN